MNTREWLKGQAQSYHFSEHESDDKDVDLRPDDGCNAGDVIQLLALLQGLEFQTFVMRDNSIHVHAPHRKEHAWADRGWECPWGLSVQGCDLFRRKARV